MAKKRNNEFREKRLERDGLKQRRLKEESRWRFNHNYEVLPDEENFFFDDEEFSQDIKNHSFK